MKWAGLATIAVLAAHAAPVQGQPLSADGTPVDVIGSLSRPNGAGAGPVVLHLNAPVTVVAHVANVIEPITSVERAVEVRAVSKDVEPTLAAALRGGQPVAITGRLWWTGTTGAATNYVVEAESVTSPR